MDVLAPVVYVLCTLSCTIVFLLLFRAYQRHRTHLLLWSALAFVALALNNLFVFIDVIILTEVDLQPLRDVFSLGAIGLLIYSFIWEIE